MIVVIISGVVYLCLIVVTPVLLWKYVSGWLYVKALKIEVQRSVNRKNLR